MGAVQAQDYGQSLWALAARLREPSIAAVEAAVEAGTILRTWPMRGTIHWVPAADAHWMVALSQDRMLSAHRARQRQLGITDDTVDRARDLLVGALRGGRRLARPDVMATWTDGGVVVDGQRGYHLLWVLAHERLIAIGPMAGRQQTFVLLDEFVPAGDRAAYDDPGSELARRYLRSHAPCTPKDFAWWAGITLAEARRRFEVAGAVPATTNRRDLWAPLPLTPGTGPTTLPTGVGLIAGFDEFLLGYQQRGDVLPTEVASRIVPGNNGIFLPGVVEDGIVVGTWRRVVTRDRVDVTVVPFGPTAPSQDALTRAAGRYAKAVGRASVAVTVER
ncbi:MAG: winged helix DNA-binding domain-containing protein [Nakamurella sp.]